MNTKKKVKKETSSAGFDYRTITSIEVACKKQNVPVPKLEDFSAIHEDYRKPLLSVYRLLIISDAINNGWKPNYFDGSIKYEPWHWIKADATRPSGFGFSVSSYDITRTGARLGARLVKKTMAEAIFFAEQFEEDWMNFKLIC